MAIAERTPWMPNMRLIDANDLLVSPNAQESRSISVLSVVNALNASSLVANEAILALVRRSKNE